MVKALSKPWWKKNITGYGESDGYWYLVASPVSGVSPTAVGMIDQTPANYDLYIYTITVNTANVEAEYIHLIDNMTGMDVDLLATPSYSFHAKTSDYASRFKLVFGVKDTEPAEATDTFTFISNGEIIVSNEGRATLQLIDVMGRIVSSEEINGECRISTNGLTAGLYILNLDGRTQKIVVR